MWYTSQCQAIQNEVKLKGENKMTNSEKATPRPWNLAGSMRQAREKLFIQNMG